MSLALGVGNIPHQPWLISVVLKYLALPCGRVIFFAILMNISKVSIEECIFLEGCSPFSACFLSIKDWGPRVILRPPFSALPLLTFWTKQFFLLMVEYLVAFLGSYPLDASSTTQLWQSKMFLTLPNIILGQNYCELKTPIWNIEGS